MKKVLSLLGLIAVISMTNLAQAAPPPPPGGHGHGHVVAAGPGHAGMHRPAHGHYAPPPPPPHRHYYRGGAVIGGVLARRSYWRYPYECDYRLGWCDDFYYVPRPYHRNGVYINFGIPIRF